jgi:alkylation response protein AidB-like acyl-CoA dehydrogenase
MVQIPGLKFPLGEEIEMLRDSIASFAAKEIAPRAAQIDRTDNGCGSGNRRSLRRYSEARVNHG